MKCPNITILIVHYNLQAMNNQLHLCSLTTTHKYVGLISLRANLKLQKYSGFFTKWSKTQIHILRIDTRKEYFSNVLGIYLSDHVIIHQTSCVDTLQQNGVTKRKNQHSLEVTSALMFQMDYQNIIRERLF